MHLRSDDELQPWVHAVLWLEARKYTYPPEFVDHYSYFFYNKSHDELETRSEPLLEHISDIENRFSKISSDHWNADNVNGAI